jgi:hypothetical protein
MLITIAILKKSNKLSLQFSKLSRIFIPHFWSKLHQFFTKVQNSCCFVFLGHCSPTVLVDPLPKASKSQLFIPCSTMVIQEFLLLDRVWAEITSPFIFLYINLDLFWTIGAKSIKNNNCLQLEVNFRISLFFKLWYAFWSAFNVDQHDALSFWND